ncbi:MAG: Fic/DOC family N-terminal domain-containing protein, partial [bacterium]
MLETPEVLRQLVRSHRALAELKGIATVIPDASILISTLVIQEARDSSTIENIITSQDEVFTAMLDEERSTNLAAKEVHRYARAVTAGYTILQKQSLLRTRDLIAIHGTLCDSTTGFRRVPGTVLK